MTAKVKSKRKEELGKKYNGFIFFLLCAFVFVVPLTIFPYTVDIFELPKVTLVRLFILCLLVIWAFKIYRTGKIEFKRNPLDLPVFSFAIVALLASLFSVNLILSLFGSYYRYEGIFTILAYIFLYFTATQVLDIKRLNLLLYLFTASAGLNAAYGIFQHFGYDFIKLTGRVFELSRSSGTLGNPVFLGALLVTAIPISLANIIKEKKAFARFVLLLLFPLQITALVYTSTRAAWLGFAALLLILALALPRRTSFREAKVIGIALILILLSLFILSRFYVPEGGTILERTFSIFQPRGSAATRLDMWKGSLKLVRDRPIIGFGWETFEGTFPLYSTEFLMSQEELPDRPHNQFLYVGTSTGLLGVFTYLWILLSLYGLAFKRIFSTEFPTNKKVWLGILLAGITGYYIQEQFSISTAGVTPVFWIFLGLIAVLSKEEKERYLWKEEVGSTAKSLIIFAIGFIVLIGSIINFKFFTADIYYRLGIKEKETFYLADRINHLEKAVTLNSYMNRYRSALGQAYLQQAISGQNPRGVEQAILVYEEGLQVDPKDEAMWIQLGDLYLSQAKNEEDLRKAAQAYKTVLDFHPNSAGAYWALGDLHLSEQDNETALQYLEQAGSLVPRHTGVLLSLAEAYERSGRRKKAEEVYLKVLEIEPENERARKALKK